MKNHLNFFTPYESAAAWHENQLTRALLVVLRYSPIAHQAWLHLVSPNLSLQKLPRAEFATQRQRVVSGHPQVADGDSIPGISVWLAPDESSGPLLAEWQKKHGDRFKPAPAWNTMRIEVRRTKIKTWLNGHLLADFSDEAPVAIPRGFFALQVHATKNKELFGKAVAFRNLRVMKLE